MSSENGGEQPKRSRANRPGGILPYGMRPNSQAAGEGTLKQLGVEIVTPVRPDSLGVQFEVPSLGPDGKRIKPDDPQ